MLFAFGPCRNPHRIALIGFGECRNLARDGGRKHHGATFGRGLAKDEFQILAEPQIQHFVGLVQHGDAQTAQIQRITLDMVLQPPWRAHDDMCAPVQIAPLGAHIHATDAGRKAGLGRGIKPLQFAVNLQSQFAGWGNDQRQWGRRRAKPVGPVQQPLRHRQPKRHGLARPGLG